ncbi:hematopoietic SH2 domain-containing protein homolog [Nothobranchius furzeri]|uniref:Hematopoietic SH2 domain containing n=2 Tax=Nothobranchius furzeri TaxID=105023 RepID=A0A8C6Q2W6_NOTFU|nr:hematopoietic SH2 domain containing [Nothobranchius furzeri]
MMEWSQPSQGQHDPFTWFKESQLQLVFRNGSVPDWFHGIISRKTAEELLMPKPPGYFLIRVGESRIGYTLSYRADDRCRHFMVDALVDSHYMIVGENRRHRSLQDLVEFHRRTPIMPFNQVLTIACEQPSNIRADYAELLFPQRQQASNTRSPAMNSPQPSSPGPEEETPPALPYRPDKLKDSAVPLPNNPPNRLYPSLDNEFSHITSPPPDSHVPEIQTIYAVTQLPANQPPEVPSRSRMLQRQNQLCTRTVSVPGSPSLPPAPGRRICPNIQPPKSQESRPSVITNLKTLKLKFQKKTNNPQENVYSEISDVTPDNRRANTENEYQEITGPPTFAGSPLHTGVKQTDQVLPIEYHPPPRFAPGY